MEALNRGKWSSAALTSRYSSKGLIKQARVIICFGGQVGVHCVSSDPSRAPSVCIYRPERIPLQVQLV